MHKISKHMNEFFSPLCRLLVLIAIVLAISMKIKFENFTSMKNFFASKFCKCVEWYARTFNESTMNVLSDFSWWLFRSFFLIVVPIFGASVIFLYLFINEISPRGFSLADVVPFVLATINLSVIMLFFLLFCFLLAVIATISVNVILSLAGWLGKWYWSAVGAIVIIALEMLIIFNKIHFEFLDPINNVVTEFYISVGLVLSDVYFFIVTLLLGAVIYVFLGNLSSILNKRASANSRQIDKIKINLVGYLVVFLFLFFVVLVAVPMTSWVSIVENIVERTGLRFSNATVAVDSQLYKLMENKEYELYGRMVGCEDDNVYFINNLQLVWHGIGDVTYAKIIRSPRGALPKVGVKPVIPSYENLMEIQNSAIVLTYKNPSVIRFCRSFSGSYFKANSTEPGDDFYDLVDFIEKMKLQFPLDAFEGIEIEWSADPMFSKGGNFKLSKSRAREVKSRVYAAYCPRQGKDNSVRCGASVDYSANEKSVKWIEIKPAGSSSEQHSCKDWPVKKTLNECLSKNRGGKITIYVKRY